MDKPNRQAGAKERDVQLIPLTAFTGFTTDNAAVNLQGELCRLVPIMAEPQQKRQRRDKSSKVTIINIQ